MRVSLWLLVLMRKLLISRCLAARMATRVRVISAHMLTCSGENRVIPFLQRNSGRQDDALLGHVLDRKHRAKNKWGFATLESKLSRFEVLCFCALFRQLGGGFILVAENTIAKYITYEGRHNSASEERWRPPPSPVQRDI
eukprot:TRINITY_DN4802_c0_g2_i1.p2 TRINITY_DN4802_c0_g2~~TRINITY_DN4802_c0_g2_i1.p2  ORF type:complete len:140 (-),score=12.47 TRINITY_DN4802_c0_g2_i1:11-430(-)